MIQPGNNIYTRMLYANIKTQIIQTILCTVVHCLQMLYWHAKIAYTIDHKQHYTGNLRRREEKKTTQNMIINIQSNKDKYKQRNRMKAEAPCHANMTGDSSNDNKYYLSNIFAHIV